MPVPTEIVKTKIGPYSREYILNLANPFDDVLKFESVSDDIGEGLFKVKLNAFFLGGNQLYAPPIAHISANIAIHGLLKVYKIISELRPEGRPVFGGEPAGTAGTAYAYASDQVESLIFPSSDPNSLIYEPMFFYNFDASSFGYFVEQELIVNINQQSSAYFRWGSTASDRYATLISGELTLMKLSSS